MSDSVELDPRHLLTAAGIGSATSITPVTGGWDTALWRIEHGGRTSALRVYPPGREASWRTELAALEAAAAVGIPVPSVRSRGIWQERPWLLLAWSPGVTLQEALFGAPEQAGVLGFAFGQTQARIHQIRVDVAASHHQVFRDCFDGVDAWPELAERLGQDSIVEDRLLHIDYHPLNVLVEDGAVTAVLDWANARRGDPRADLARTRGILRFARMMPGGGIGLRTILSDFEAGWLRGYQATAGPLPPMPLFDAWSAQFLVDDLSPKVGQPGVWLTDSQVGVLRRRAAAWARRAGMAAMGGA